MILYVFLLLVQCVPRKGFGSAVCVQRDIYFSKNNQKIYALFSQRRCSLCVFLTILQIMHLFSTITFSSLYVFLLLVQCVPRKKFGSAVCVQRDIYFSKNNQKIYALFSQRRCSLCVFLTILQIMHLFSTITFSRNSLFQLHIFLGNLNSFNNEYSLFFRIKLSYTTYMLTLLANLQSIKKFSGRIKKKQFGQVTLL